MVDPIVRFIAGSAAFYVAYLLTVALFAWRHLTGGTYTGTAMQAHDAFETVVSETAMWAIFVTLGQGIVMALVNWRKSRLTLRQTLGIQMLLAVLVVLFGDLMTSPATIFLMPIGLTAVAYGMLRLAGKL